MNTSSSIFTCALLIAASGSFAQSTAPAAPGPTDAQIAHIVMTANQVDIDAGKLAATKGHAKDAKAFGKEMVTDHTGVNRRAGALVTKLKVTPEDNPTSQSLKSGGAENVTARRALKGAAFDKAYRSHEVAYHLQVIDAIDKVLIPSAKNAELKDLIVKVRPAFVAHLEHARAIEAALK